MLNYVHQLVASFVCVPFGAGHADESEPKQSISGPLNQNNDLKYAKRAKIWKQQ